MALWGRRRDDWDDGADSSRRGLKADGGRRALLAVRRRPDLPIHHMVSELGFVAPPLLLLPPPASPRRACSRRCAPAPAAARVLAHELVPPHASSGVRPRRRAPVFPLGHAPELRRLVPPRPSPVVRAWARVAPTLSCPPAWACP
ncbi:hypothetical protein GUJ93_ZPchr0013g37984 [Zizania palustris]|uniref:Uncharacterized protein n=1 Tax=Zizania palustris TaxID=103762 RepID=A0A8J5X1M4_ZIZPA|nr:hypothetical protein GUJ93_ZPchr0013g37984 [Zizania palustris]